METCGFRSCDSCPGKVVCHCLQVTEEVVVEAISVLDLRSVKEVRHATGAGDGCTACHRRLRNLLDSANAESAHPPAVATAPSPI